jgi:hypothetical protein
MLTLMERCGHTSPPQQGMRDGIERCTSFGIAVLHVASAWHRTCSAVAINDQQRPHGLKPAGFNPGWVLASNPGTYGQETAARCVSLHVSSVAGEKKKAQAAGLVAHLGLLMVRQKSGKRRAASPSALRVRTCPDWPARKIGVQKDE